jgi:uncharacterized protein YkwD
MSEPVDDYRDLRSAAKKSELERKRAQRRAKLVENIFLGIAALFFTTGLTLFGAYAYGVLSGLDMHLDEKGVMGDVLQVLFEPVSASSAADPEIPTPRSTRGLPSPIPSATPSITPTASSTSTPTITPTVSATRTTSPTRTVSLTPSRTLAPSRTPTVTETPFGYQSPTATRTATSPPTATSYPDCDFSGNSDFESALLTLINDERDSEGLPALDQEDRLRDAARAHSTDMACNGIFSHTGSDGSTVGERVTAQGYEWILVAENIFRSGDTSDTAPQLAFNWWMVSPSQRANLLSDTFTEIGIGYIFEPSSPYGGYFTAVFAQP